MLAEATGKGLNSTVHSVMFAQVVNVRVAIAAARVPADELQIGPQYRSVVGSISWPQLRWTAWRSRVGKGFLLWWWWWWWWTLLLLKLLKLKLLLTLLTLLELELLKMPLLELKLLLLLLLLLLWSVSVLILVDVRSNSKVSLVVGSNGSII